MKIDFFKILLNSVEYEAGEEHIETSKFEKGLTKVTFSCISNFHHSEQVNKL